MKTVIAPFDKRQNTDRRNQPKKEPIRLLTRKYLIARIYVGLSITIALLIALFDSSSNTYKALHLSAIQTSFFYGMLVIAILAVIDSVVNDFLPDKFVLIHTYNYRHIVLMALSLISFSISAAILYADPTSLLIIRFWLDGTIAAVCAILDIFARHKEQ